MEKVYIGGVIDRLEYELSIVNKLRGIIENWDYEIWLFNNKKETVISSLKLIIEEEEFSEIKREILEKIDNDIETSKDKVVLEEFRNKVENIGNDAVKVI